MNSSALSISAEEHEQIVQTIEMFEVIVEANPQDCQSMEILKDAYQRIGKSREAMAMAKRLGETYMNLGEFSSALLEYEGILQQDPDSLEIIAALGEVEERMHNAAAGVQAPDATTISLDFQAAIGDLGVGSLITTEETRSHSGGGRSVTPGRVEDVIATLTDDGNAPLARFLIQHQLVSEDIVSAALQRVQKFNLELAPNRCAASLIDDITRRGFADTTALLCGILDRTKFAYIPLYNYDVDRQIVKMLPESLTLGRLIVPFDLISRTVMVATANPFDAKGKNAVQQVLDFHIQWHLAEPDAIIRVLGDVYRIPASAGGSKS